MEHVRHVALNRGNHRRADNRHHDHRPRHFGMLVIDGIERSGINGRPAGAKQNTDQHRHVYRAKAGRQRHIGQEQRADHRVKDQDFFRVKACHQNVGDKLADKKAGEAVDHKG